MVDSIQYNPETKSFGLAVGAAGGAMLGAKVGTLIGGPIGTAIGAGVGTAAGAAGSYLRHRRKERNDLLKHDRDMNRIDHGVDWRSRRAARDRGRFDLASHRVTNKTQRLEAKYGSKARINEARYQHKTALGQAQSDNAAKVELNRIDHGVDRMSQKNNRFNQKFERYKYNKQREDDNERYHRSIGVDHKEGSLGTALKRAGIRRINKL